MTSVLDLQFRFVPSRYKSIKTTKAVTLAVREDYPGGNAVIDLLTLLHETVNNRRRSAVLNRVIDLVYDDVDASYAMMREDVYRRYNMPSTQIDYQPTIICPAISSVGGVPIWCAWVKVAMRDTRYLPPEEHDYNGKIKMWLQDILIAFGVFAQ